MPPHELRDIDEIYDDVLSRLGGVEEHGEYALAFCPVHPNSDTPALSVKKHPGGEKPGVGLKCLSEGCAQGAVCEAIGIEESDLFVEPPAPNGKVLKFKSVRGGQAGCTVADYAEAKGLDAAWLRRRFGLSDLKKHPKTGGPAMVIPYFDKSGAESRVRYRTAIHKPEEGPDQRFLWKSGSKADLLYGIEDLKKYREEGGAPVLVEGESDRHTLVWHGYAVLGVPGANNVYKAVDPEDFLDFDRAYAVVENGDAGEKFAESLGNLLGDKLYLVSLGEHDDASGLHLAERADFVSRFEDAMHDAIPHAERERARREEEAATHWEDCRDLALSPNVLAEFAVDLKRNGVAGLEREAKIVYLASTSRIMDQPVSLAVKGPSGAGKTWLVERVLDFAPEGAAKPITGMSDRALAYSTESFKHRHLFFYEATAIQNSEILQSMLQTLLSEGRIVYDFVDTSSEGPPETRHIEKEGPTGAFVTTTQDSLNNDNETRMLSFSVSDTRAQTRAVMKNIAKRRRKKARDDGPDFRRWRALQRWLEEAGEKDVFVPYGDWLSEQIPPVAVRLRRDFEQVHVLVECHAMLHQATRERNEDGEIVATRADYAAVRALLHDLLSEQLEASVPPEVRETVEALGALYGDLEAKSDGVGLRALSESLGVDKSSASRRVRKAIWRGFAKNLEEKRGKPARYVPADPMPEDVVVLPPAEDIPDGCCTVASVAGVATVARDAREDESVDNLGYPVDNSGENGENGADATRATPATPATDATVQRSGEKKRRVEWVD